VGRLYDATWGRVFASVYDSMLSATEEAGLRDRRAALLAQARGATLELGAGTGLNLDLYTDAVTELVLTEPGEHMARRLRERAATARRAAEVVQAPAEDLPFAADRFDTVVATLVLCTIPDPARALAEAARVLRPGGRLLFIEHVRSRDPALARWQDRLERPWRLLADGCHCNRDTIATLEASPLQVERLERGALPKAPAIARPLVAGHATAPG
jgi:ubiquinone/menaquinone biosynthesis C-methylase UbiE